MDHFKHWRIPMAAAAATLGLSGWAGAVRGDVIFSQDFSGSTTVSDYVSGTGTASQFASISADPDSTASVNISGGQLIFSFAEDSDTVPQGGGTFTHLDLGSPDLMSARFTFTISNPSGNNNGSTRAALTLGRNASGAIRSEIQFTITSSGINIALRASGLGTTTISAGAETALTMYQNDSADAAMFVGPDGQQHTIDPDKVWLFVNNNAFAQNVAIQKNEDAAALFFAINTDTFQKPNLDNVSFAFDEIVIRDDLGIVPEPASVALLGAGAVIMLPRRSKGRGVRPGERR